MELVFIITNCNQINFRKNKPKTFYFHSNKDDFGIIKKKIQFTDSIVIMGTVDSAG